MYIPKDQNSKKSLQLLAAQRQLYTDAKYIQKWQLILTVISVIAWSFIVLRWEYLKVYDAAWGIILLFIDLFFLTPKINSMRIKAAKVQELFDCELFHVSWNDICAGEKPDEDEISEASSKYYRKNKGYKVLRDWYNPKIGKLSFEKSVFACQKINCWWDSKLRSQYANLIVYFLVLITIFILFIALLNGLTVENFILTVFLPLVPIFSLGIKQYLENKEAATQQNELKKYIQKLLREFKAKNKRKIQQYIRELQNEIYVYRKTSPLIYDFYYWIYKSNYEDQTSKVIKELE